MDGATRECRLMAQKMRQVEQELRKQKTALAFSWKGTGCDTFEIQFRLLIRQLADVTDNLWDKGEEILEAEQAYIQADVDASKAIG